MKDYSMNRVTFVEREFGKQFFCIPLKEFQLGEYDWATKHGATHVYTSEAGHQCTLKLGTTIAHVHVDEDDYGNPITEKWNIRHLKPWNV